MLVIDYLYKQQDQIIVISWAVTLQAI